MSVLARFRFSHRLSRRQRIAQLSNRAFIHWMARVGGDFGQGLKHKPALVHSGVGNGKRRNFDDRTAKQQNVDVDGARSFLLIALASHLLLKRQDRGDELPRHFFGVQLDGAIQKPGLRSDLDRLGFVERRYAYGVTNFVQLLNRGAQVGFAVAQVRSQ